MEVLSDILRSIRVEGSVYFCDQLETPWTKEFRGSESAGFHLIRRGSCWAIQDDHVELLGPGDLIFVGPGVDLVLTSQSPDGNRTGAAEKTLLLCGYCNFFEDTMTPLLDVFPKITVVHEEELISHPWLKSTFDQLSARYMSQHPGAELVVNKLTEVVLIELIRINFGRKEGHPFLDALNDKRISKALLLIHENPQRQWTLEDLAGEIGMSRAAFAKRFRDMVGQTVFRYLTGLRMQRSRELLRESALPVFEIASRTGYESERAFTRTFKKYVGTTPKRYRNEPRLPVSEN